MGATVFGNTIYISKDLDATLTKKERHIVWAHEIGHWKYKHRILKALFFVFTLGIPPFNRAFSRFLEIQADRYALRITKDPESFITLMDKLKHDKNTYPSKDYRIELAKQFKREI